jgi:phosphatidylglycerol:prolipoprotein diacylglycerol transferase
MKLSTNPRIAFAIIFVLLIFFLLALKGVIYLPPAVQVGPLNLHFYSIAILSGIFASAFLVNKYKKKHRELDALDIEEALFWVVIPGIIFARIWYVIIFANVYLQQPLHALYIWEGGLSIYGAYVGGILGAYFYTKKINVSLLKTLELAFVFIPIAQILGRFGNFLNQELYGPVTNLPWSMYVRETKTYNHPAFLYEQVGNAIIFWILFKYYQRNGLKNDGKIIAMYLTLYGIVRFIVDIFRNDAREIAGLTIAQVISIFMVLGGAGYLLYLKYNPRKGINRQYNAKN